MDFSYEYDRAALKDKDYALAVVTDSVQAFTQALLDDLQSQGLLEKGMATTDVSLGFGLQVARSVAFRWHSKVPQGQ